MSPRFALAACALVLGACASATPPEPAEHALFWDAFHAQEYGRIAEVRMALESARAADPANPRTTLLYAHTGLWRIAEWGRDPSQSPAEIPGIAFATLTAFEEAHAASPDDHRIHGWLGAMRMAAGRATGDTALVASGQALLDEGVELHPQFNLFVRALSLGGAPRGSTEMAGAIDAMWETLDVCAGAEVDRANPDFRPYFGRATEVGPDRVCWNDALAPHNFEGFFLYFGDWLLKEGDVDGAVAQYRNATRIEDYAAWPFRADLEARIEGAAARAALHADADPSNDPPLVSDGPTQCAVCHATE
jgi:hypothetical protein